MIGNKKSVKIAFLGDISLNDEYIDLYKQKINPFLKLDPLLSEQDCVIGNLECLPRGNDGENILKKPRLTTTVETLKYLTNIHLDIACLAQNHIYDHLEDGFDKTTSFLKDINIKYLGAGKTKKDASEEIILDKNGLKIGILNYVTSDTNPNLPDDSKVYLNVFNLRDAQEKIKTLRPVVNHIILQLHWGGRVEGGLYPDFDQPKIARKLINAGADLIIGHHSHTIQPFEVYKGKYIFYSLGNFCFADLNFEGELYPLKKQSKQGLLAVVEFSKREYKTDLIFIDNINNTLAINNSKNLKVNNFIHSKIFKHKPFWKLYFLYHRRLSPIIAFLQRKDYSLIEKINRIWYFGRKYIKNKY